MTRTRFRALLCLALTCVALSACGSAGGGANDTASSHAASGHDSNSAADMDSSGSRGGDDGTSGGLPEASSSDGAGEGASFDPESESEPPLEGEPEQTPGTLTAGAWDDNRNFERFQSYRSDLLQSGLTGALPTTDAEHAAAHDLFGGERAAHQKLDIALVIDTTGSMGDEITYLQTELGSIAQAIAKAYPDADERWSLVVYRDEGDDYLTRTFDFGDTLEQFRTKLAAQSAGGGGDFPEAVDAGLTAMNELTWRTGNDVARLAFWLADAPHHDDKADEVADALRKSKGLDVHIYPVASSGVDELAELTMRSAAQLTGGRYLFLTDDSGVGGAHKEPSIPCYFVTKLDDAIVRMVDIELSGKYREPEKSEILRTGGNVQDGACKLESGETAQAF